MATDFHMLISAIDAESRELSYLPADRSPLQPDPHAMDRAILHARRHGLRRLLVRRLVQTCYNAALDLDERGGQPDQDIGMGPAEIATALLADDNLAVGYRLAVLQAAFGGEDIAEIVGDALDIPQMHREAPRKVMPGGAVAMLAGFFGRALDPMAGARAAAYGRAAADGEV